MTKPSIFATGDNKNYPCQVLEIGKYWGLHCATWRRLKITALPCQKFIGGTIQYAPISKDAYNFSLRGCSVVYGPLNHWGKEPPKFTKKTLLKLGVSEFWLIDRINR